MNKDDDLGVVRCAVAIGDGAIANEDFQLAIKVLGFEGKTQMTYDEYLVISNVLHRMEFKETQMVAQ